MFSSSEVPHTSNKFLNHSCTKAVKLSMTYSVDNYLVFWVFLFLVLNIRAYGFYLFGHPVSVYWPCLNLLCKHWCLFIQIPSNFFYNLTIKNVMSGRESWWTFLKFTCLSLGWKPAVKNKMKWSKIICLIFDIKSTWGMNKFIFLSIYML